MRRSVWMCCRPSQTEMSPEVSPGLPRIRNPNHSPELRPAPESNPGPALFQIRNLWHPAELQKIRSGNTGNSSMPASLSGRSLKPGRKFWAVSMQILKGDLEMMNRFRGGNGGTEKGSDIGLCPAPDPVLPESG